MIPHCPLENFCDWVRDEGCDKENYEDCVAYREWSIMTEYDRDDIYFFQPKGLNTSIS